VTGREREAIKTPYANGNGPKGKKRPLSKRPGDWRGYLRVRLLSTTPWEIAARGKWQVGVQRKVMEVRAGLLARGVQDDLIEWCVLNGAAPGEPAASEEVEEELIPRRH
jgi:hypothetical protein